MNNERLAEITECMCDMDDKAKIWSMVRAISHILADEDISFNQFLTITEIIAHYTYHEAEFIGSEDDIEIDIDGEDGEWFPVSAIG